MQIVGTLNSRSTAPGVNVVYESGGFAYEGGDALALEHVLQIDAAGQIDWVTSETRAWAYSLRQSPPDDTARRLSLPKWVIVGVALAILLVLVICCSMMNGTSDDQVDRMGDDTPKSDTTELPPDSDSRGTNTQDSVADSQATIPGLTAADVKIDLENTWGLEFSGPEPGETLWIDHGEVIDPDTGVTLLCDIYEESPEAIVMVEFAVEAFAVTETTPSSDVDLVTAGYFGYCATVPYEDAQPESARAWIEANVPAATVQGTVLEQAFGPARFCLNGVPYMRSLEIVPAE